MTVGTVLITVATILSAALMVLCSRGVIRRNPIAGMRVRATMASDEAWRVGHRAAIPVVTVAAVIDVVLAIIAIMDTGAATEGFFMVTVLVLLAGVLLGGLFASRAAAKVGDKR